MSIVYVHWGDRSDGSWKRSLVAPRSTASTFSTEGGHMFHQSPHPHTHIKTSMAALHAGKDYALGPRTWPNLVELTTNHHYVGWYLKSPKWNSYTNPGDISSETPLMSLSTWDRHPHLSASNFYLFRCALDGDDALRSLQSGDAEPGQTMDKT